MIDCSITENYLEEKERLCKRYYLCSNCPIYNFCRKNVAECKRVEAEGSNTKEVISIVQKWSDEHPQKTYWDDFLEKFPKAAIHQNGCPACCRNLVYGIEGGCRGKMCGECWNEVMPDGND